MSPVLYEFVVDSDGFANFETEDEQDLDLFIDGFEALPMAATWPAPRIRLSEAAARSGAPLPDFASIFGAVPVLSQAALNALRPKLDDVGELLPLGCAAAEYWALNVTSVVDLMDEARSLGDWFGPGRLMNLRQLMQKDGASAALPLSFKLPQWRKGRALLTDEFMNIVEAHGLTGLTARAITAQRN
ncbi:MAG: hypothetical protein MSC31_19505 [Solirubrobacteraceae bacterium MAG38_C4-C5]|nr:hypothetical protein [Candidatus Siliceabacter maunaloa]